MLFMPHYGAPEFSLTLHVYMYIYFLVTRWSHENRSSVGYTFQETLAQTNVDYLNTTPLL